MLTSSGVVDTRILDFETGSHDHGRGCDESPAAVGGLTSNSNNNCSRFFETQQACAAQRECVASSIGRLVRPLESERSRGRIEGA